MKIKPAFTLLILLFILYPTSSLAKKKNKKKTKDYPMKVNARPLVLPKGMSEATGALSQLSLRSRSLQTGLDLGFKHGIVKGVEVGGSTAVGLQPQVEWSSSFALKAGYRFRNRKKGLATAVQIDIPLSFGNGREAFNGFTGGFATRYRLNKKWAVHSGEGMLAVTLGKEVRTRINIPIGLAVQVNRQFNLRFDTKIATVGTGHTHLAIDSLPLTLRGIYAVNRMMDVGAVLQGNLAQNDASKVLMALFSYRMR